MNEQMLVALYGQLGLEERGVTFEQFTKDMQGNTAMQQHVHSSLGLSQKGVDFEQFQRDLQGGAMTRTVEPIVDAQLPERAEEQQSEKLGFWNSMVEAGRQGLAQGATVSEGINALIEGANLSSEEIEEIIANADKLDRGQGGTYTDRFMKGENFGGVGDWAGLAAETFLQSGAALLRGMIDSFEQPETAAATTAGMATGLVTAGAGAAASMGVQSAFLEASGKFYEGLQEEVAKRNLPLNEKGIRTVLNDEEAFNNIRNKAAVKGLVVGAVDAATGLFSAKVGANIGKKLAERGAQGLWQGMADVGRVTGTGFAIEGPGGMFGEAASTMAIGEELNWKEIALEGLGEGPSAVITAGSGAISEIVKARREGGVLTEDPQEILELNYDKESLRQEVELGNREAFLTKTGIAVDAGQISADEQEFLIKKYDELAELSEKHPNISPITDEEYEAFKSGQVSDEVLEKVTTHLEQGGRDPRVQEIINQQVPDEMAREYINRKRAEELADLERQGQVPDEQVEPTDQEAEGQTQEGTPEQEGPGTEEPLVPDDIYEGFVNTGAVPVTILEALADKIVANVPLTPREQAIISDGDRMADIEEILTQRRSREEQTGTTEDTQAEAEDIKPLVTPNRPRNPGEIVEFEQTFTTPDTKEDIAFNIKPSIEDAIVPVDGKKLFLGMQGRFFTFVNINGVTVPFYISSQGTSGKQAGKWYPFFGLNSRGWLIKGSLEQMENGYGVPEIKAMQERLNNEMMVPTGRIHLDGQLKLRDGGVFIDLNDFIDFGSYQTGLQWTENPTELNEKVGIAPPQGIDYNKPNITQPYIEAFTAAIERGRGTTQQTPTQTAEPKPFNWDRLREATDEQIEDQLSSAVSDLGVADTEAEKGSFEGRIRALVREIARRRAEAGTETPTLTYRGTEYTFDGDNWVTAKGTVAAENRQKTLNVEYAKKRLEDPNRVRFQDDDDVFDPNQLEAIVQNASDLGVEIDVDHRDGVIRISNIRTDEEVRGEGRARAAMEEIISYADDTGQSVSLTPTNEFGANRQRLENFYRGLGFVPNTGQNKNFMTRDSFVRPPKRRIQFQDEEQPNIEEQRRRIQEKWDNARVTWADLIKEKLIERQRGKAEIRNDINSRKQQVREEMVPEGEEREAMFSSILRQINNSSVLGSSLKNTMRRKLNELRTQENVSQEEIISEIERYGSYWGFRIKPHTTRRDRALDELNAEESQIEDDIANAKILTENIFLPGEESVLPKIEEVEGRLNDAIDQMMEVLADRKIGEQLANTTNKFITEGLDAVKGGPRERATIIGEAVIKYPRVPRQIKEALGQDFIDQLKFDARARRELWKERSRQMRDRLNPEVNLQVLRPKNEQEFARAINWAFFGNPLDSEPSAEAKATAAIYNQVISNFAYKMGRTYEEMANTFLRGIIKTDTPTAERLGNVLYQPENYENEALTLRDLVLVYRKGASDINLPAEERAVYAEKLNAISEEALQRQIVADILLGNNHETNSYNLDIFNDPAVNEFSGKMMPSQVLRDHARRRAKAQGSLRMEAQLIEEALEFPMFKGKKKIPYDDFRRIAEALIMPLKVINTPAYNDYGSNRVGMFNQGNLGNITYETHVYNSSQDHGFSHHFAPAYETPERTQPRDWYIEERTYRGQTWYVVVDRNTSPTSIADLENNIGQFVGTATPNRESAEKWIAFYEQGGQAVNMGEFGHTRVWYTEDSAFLAEVQSDFYQGKKLPVGMRPESMIHAATRRQFSLGNGQAVPTKIRELLTEERELRNKYRDTSRAIDQIPRIFQGTYPLVDTGFEDAIKRIDDDLRLELLSENYNKVVGEKDRVKTRLKSESGLDATDTTWDMLADMALYFYANRAANTQAAKRFMPSLKREHSSLDEITSTMVSTLVTQSSEDFVSMSNLKLIDIETVLLVDSADGPVIDWDSAFTAISEFAPLKKQYDKFFEEFDQRFMDAAPLDHKQFLSFEKTWPKRLLREEIRRTALAGKKELLLPVLKTVSLIEQWVNPEDTSGDAQYTVVGRKQPGQIIQGDLIEHAGDLHLVLDSPDQGRLDGYSDTEATQNILAVMSHHYTRYGYVDTLVQRLTDEISDYEYVYDYAGENLSNPYPQEMVNMANELMLLKFAGKKSFNPESEFQRLHKEYRTYVNTKFIEHFTNQITNNGKTPNPPGNTISKVFLDYVDIDSPLTQVEIISMYDNSYALIENYFDAWNQTTRFLSEEAIRKLSEAVQKEEFTHRDLPEEYRGLGRRYENLIKDFKKLRPDAQEVTVEGHQWIRTAITPEDRGPIIAFQDPVADGNGRAQSLIEDAPAEVSIESSFPGTFRTDNGSRITMEPKDGRLHVSRESTVTNKDFTKFLNEIAKMADERGVEVVISNYTGAPSEYTSFGRKQAVRYPNGVPVQPTQKGGKRGATIGVFGSTQSAPKLLAALESPNKSTALHELAHLFEDWIDAIDPLARATVLSDYNTFARKNGFAEKTRWDAEVSEYFARNWEEYFRQGPNVRAKHPLKAVFDNFTRWLQEIYNGVVQYKGRDINLSDEMRSLFDDILGVRDESQLKQGLEEVESIVENQGAVKDSEYVMEMNNATFNNILNRLGMLNNRDPLTQKPLIDGLRTALEQGYHIPARAKEYAIETLNAPDRQHGLTRDIISQQLGIFVHMLRLEDTIGTLQAEIVRKRNANTTDFDLQQSLDILQELREELNLMDKAQNKIGTIFGTGLAYRGVEINRGEVTSMSYEVTKRNAEERAGRSLTDEEDAKLKDLHEKWRTAEAEHAAQDQGLYDKTRDKARKAASEEVDNIRKDKTAAPDVEDALNDLGDFINKTRQNPNVRFQEDETPAEQYIVGLRKRIYNAVRAIIKNELDIRNLNDVISRLQSRFGSDVLTEDIILVALTSLSKNTRDTSSAMYRDALRLMKIEANIFNRLEKQLENLPIGKKSNVWIRKFAGDINALEKEALKSKAFDEAVREITDSENQFYAFIVLAEEIKNDVSTSREVTPELKQSIADKLERLREARNLSDPLTAQRRLTNKITSLTSGNIASMDLTDMAMDSILYDAQKRLTAKTALRAQLELNDYLRSLDMQRRFEKNREAWGAFGRTRVGSGLARLKTTFLDQDFWNAFRTMLSMFDLSMLFNQAGTVTITAFKHPRMFWEAFSQSIKAYQDLVDASDTIEGKRVRLKQQFGRQVYEQLTQDPLHYFRRLAGVDIIDPSSDTLSEEWFDTRFLDNVPVIGGMKKGSESSYTTFMNIVRARMFDNYVKNDPSILSNPESLGALGEMINTITGRSKIPEWKLGGKQVVGPGFGAAFGFLFFAPRYYVSRIKILAKLPTLIPGIQNVPGIGKSRFVIQDPVARKFYRREIGAAMAAYGLLFTIAGALGGLEWDPRKNMLFKIRIGDKSFDLTAGLGQFIRVAAQLTTKARDSVIAPDGKNVDVKPSNQWFTSMTDAWDIISNFAKYKLHPGFNVLLMAFDGTDAIGRPLGRTLGERLLMLSARTIVPISLQQAADPLIEPSLTGKKTLFDADYWTTDTGLILAATLGMGVTDYNNRAKDKMVVDYLDSLGMRIPNSIPSKPPEWLKNSEYYKHYFRQDFQNILGQWIAEKLEEGITPNEEVIKSKARIIRRQLLRRYEEEHGL